MNRSSLKQHMVEGPVTCDFTLHSMTRDHTGMILELSWDGLWTHHLRSNNSMVTALGLHVKWPK